MTYQEDTLALLLGLLPACAVDSQTLSFLHGITLEVMAVLLKGAWAWSCHARQAGC
jgi:hypothetical protein